MTFVLESISSDRKIAFPEKSKAFQLKNLNAILQNYAYTRWLSTRYSVVEYNYVISYKVKSTFSIKAFPIHTNDSTIPDINKSALKKSELVTVSSSSDIQYMSILSHEILTGKLSDIKTDKLNMILMLIDGDWYVTMNHIPGFDLSWMTNLSMISIEYGDISGKYNPPKLKIQGMNSNLTIIQAIRLLQKLSREDQNIDSWVSMLEVSNTFDVVAIPSVSSSAKFKPDYAEFANNYVNRFVTLTISRNSAIPYYYSGTVSDFECMIIFVNGKWFLLDSAQARFAINNSKDEARSQRLQSKFAIPTKSETDLIIDKFSDYVTKSELSANSDMQATVKSVETNWFIGTFTKVNENFIQSDTSELFELPAISILVLTITNDNVTTNFAYINKEIYEIAIETAIELNKLESVTLWTNE